MTATLSHRQKDEIARLEAENETLRGRVAKLEEAARWRRIDEGSPLSSPTRACRSDVVLVARKAGTRWEYSLSFFDFNLGGWDDLVDWAHWRPIGEHPKEVSDGE